MGETLRAIGLMSGTSMDGIDVALIETDGARSIQCGPHASFPLGPDDRALLRRALTDAAGLEDRAARPGCLAEAESLVTLRHAEAVEAFCAAQSIAQSEIDLVGFHGQTVLHRPNKKLTVQLGDGQALASRLKMNVTWDFRAADVAAGGQGAPLVPIYHQALVESAGLAGPVVLINIGGVANLTYVAGGDEDPIACDSGPGNALLDDLILARTGGAFDRDGSISGAGHIDDKALGELLAHPFFAAPPPKSLDRNAFSAAPVAGLSTEDAAATLVAFTAASIAQTVDMLPGKPRLAIVCGGGGHNPSLMREIAARLSCGLVTSDTLGWSLDAMEAQAFAYLAVRRMHDWPISFPATTGVQAPLTGGILSRPN